MVLLSRRARLLVAISAPALLGLGITPAASATAAPVTTLNYTIHDLGTLGGTQSAAFGLDAHTVVGDSFIAGDAAFHAFAYDRTTGTFTDLGTLGGTDSRAIAVAGRFVIGQSDTASGGSDPFFYDLAKHQIADMGSLGGTSSRVTAISGHFAIGTSTLAGDQVQHAFAFDLATRTMIDLGSFAGPAGNSFAEAIDGHTVVGGSAAPGGLTRAFAYDLRTRTMTDLGSLGGSFSVADAISGDIVAGASTPSGGGQVHGVTFDLDTGTITDLGPRILAPLQTNGEFVTGNDGLIASAYNLTTGTITQIGPGIGVTQTFSYARDLVIGDVFAPNAHAFVDDPATNVFRYLGTLGGLNDDASQIDDAGDIAGEAATAPTQPMDVNGPFHAVLWTPTDSTG